jgi:error-prone DNA polymerase
MRPVCVSQSDWHCSVETDDTVRLGFCLVNGIREEHVNNLISERMRAPFKSIEDFKRRVELTKEELRMLAELGALNCFAEHRREAMWRVEEAEPEPLFSRSGQPRSHSERSPFDSLRSLRVNSAESKP